MNAPSPRLRLLFVCSGNLHRSVMAAALTRTMFQQLQRPVQIASAGTLGLRGRPAPYNVHLVCNEIGVDVSDHRSQGLTHSLIAHADRVIVMEEYHGDRVLKLDPEADERLIHLGDYFSPPGDVPDPIGQDVDAFRTCRDDILGALQKLLPELLAVGPRRG